MARRRDLAALLGLLLVGCPGEPGPSTSPPTPVVSATPAPPSLVPPGALAQRPPRLPDEGPVYAVDGFEAHTPPLAPGAGREALAARCSTCHSTTYVTMQPPLSRAAWEATVKKMIATFGADVPDDAAREVLEYLAAHYTPDTIEATYAALAASAPTGDDVGARVFRATCAPCHQADGAGLPGAFPPLRGHAPTLVATRREHLARLVLFGQQGPIEAAGQRYDGAMPGSPQLTDAEVAAVLNYVTRAWGNAALLPAGAAAFSPEEVAAARATPLTPREVNARR